MKLHVIFQALPDVWGEYQLRELREENEGLEKLKLKQNHEGSLSTRVSATVKVLGHLWAVLFLIQVSNKTK
jgi:hypothetical protein